MRTIVITTPPFSGSTLLCSLLSNLSVVVGVGELHRVVAQSVRWCFIGREERNCPVISPIFQDMQRIPRHELYTVAHRHIISHHPGTEVMVVADKPARIYREFLRPGEADGILLARRPEGFVAGWKRYPRRYNPYTVLPGMYRKFLRDGQAFFRKLIIVNLEELTVMPEDVIFRICQSLDLPPPTCKLQHPSPDRWHHVGGNSQSLKHPVRGHGIHPDNYWQEELTPEEVQSVRKHAGLMQTWDMLKEMSI